MHSLEPANQFVFTSATEFGCGVAPLQRVGGFKGGRDSGGTDDQFAAGGGQRLLGFDLGHDGLLRGEGWEK